MLRYLLDTNICIYVIKNRPPSLREIFNANDARLCISSVTLAELIYGAEKSAKPAHNLSVIENFAARLTVLDFNDAAASHFGEIRASLERAGKPIGAYDLMIAAHARSRGLTVVTNNEREFHRVPGLVVVNWLNARDE
ncbi:type II toxin-antitoxin system tRNA(fMet)-specific endonuclease VapC [Salinicola rhizosphaerae]|uniref:Ribonuclease VapC n=1 Tax=Salinicola rhizosphaerae TaxID=1443141 RepID=A0ABQ3E234_9GAMM|nr:tRNA(fMet)-specific endonuclease VapC [Salinicola rhizosphaerae]GHB20964.1 tRNA(fMet)-specific endonuclease VapC [Salinicola rhizosphaerae]